MDSRPFAARRLHSAQSVPILPAGSPAGKQIALNEVFFATVAKGLEALLAEELTALGADAVRIQQAGVQFAGDLADRKSVV